MSLEENAFEAMIADLNDFVYRPYLAPPMEMRYVLTEQVNEDWKEQHNKERKLS